MLKITIRKKKNELKGNAMNPTGIYRSIRYNADGKITSINGIYGMRKQGYGIQ